MSRKTWMALALLALTLYGALLAGWFSWIAGGSDSSGYANAARGIVSGTVVEEVRLLRELRLSADWTDFFVPLGHARGARPGTIAPSYPLGYPAHIALFSLVMGDRAALAAATILSALGSLVLLYLVGRALQLTPAMAASASAVLAVSPIFVIQAVQPMSDVTATFWSLAAIYGALRHERSVRFVLLAGFAFGVAVAVRPANMLLIVPLLILLRSRPKNLALAAAAAAPLAAIILATNAALYGSPFETGYGSIGELMAWSHFPDRALHYGKWLVLLFSPLVFPGGLFGRRFLAAWFGAFFLFYCFYRPYEVWWYTRFLLPAIPALILGAFLFVQRWRPAFRVATVTLLIALGVFWCDRHNVDDYRESETSYTEAMGALATRIPEKSLVVAMQMSGALKYYEGRTAVRYDWFDRDRFELLRAHAAIAGYSWYALLSGFELEEARRRTTDRWVPVAEVRGVTLYRLEAE